MFFQITIVFIISNNVGMILFVSSVTICCLLQFNFVFSKGLARYLCYLKLLLFVYTIICIIYSLETEWAVSGQEMEMWIGTNCLEVWGLFWGVMEVMCN